MRLFGTLAPVAATGGPLNPGALDWLVTYAGVLALPIAIGAAIHAGRTSRRNARYQGPELFLEGWHVEENWVYFYIKNVGKSPARNVRVALVGARWPYLRHRLTIYPVRPKDPAASRLRAGGVVTFHLRGGEQAHVELTKTQTVYLLLRCRDQAGQRHRAHFAPSAKMGKLAEGEHYISQ
ncbi:hypothetical protein GCG21_08730 [Pseudactinotalea sp. HY160]|uniref:hypothetical protein n=1 Tax=Pseudactinotalea sp. HY160 TaxID=2654490 RepID=UPI00128C7146|nr:hypothetical protein [Pseudactinotalea sp. HY160]MPV50089.1 hypothetical protein [Pseudactinotalea sp. HY160]